MKFSMLLLGILVIVSQGCSGTDTSSSLLPADGKTSLSGVVVDTHDTPVAGIPLYIQYMYPDASHETLDALLRRTDTKGNFAFENINPGLIQFRLVLDRLSDDLTEYDFISVKIGEITYYPNKRYSSFWTTYTGSFSIDSDTSYVNIKVIVKIKMRIRGKVVFKNGMPLANYPIILNLGHDHPLHSGMGWGTTTYTDINGYFTKYVSHPGYYTIEVIYKHLSIAVERFWINEGETPEDLLFTFDSHPLPRSYVAHVSEIWD